MFDDFAKKLGDLTQTLVKRTGEMTEIASLHTKVLSKKKKADDQFKALGKAYYEAHKDNATEFGDEITAINDIYNEIAALEDEISKLKEKLPEEEKQAVDAMENDTTDFVADAKNGIKEAAGAVGDAINDAISNVQDATSDGAKDAEEAAEEVKDTVEEAQE